MSGDAMNQALEKDRALRWVPAATGGATLVGEALHFLPQGVRWDVPRLVKAAFTGREPFSLAGFGHKDDGERATLQAVDLPTGVKVAAEVTSEVLTLYVYGEWNEG